MYVKESEDEKKIISWKYTLTFFSGGLYPFGKNQKGFQSCCVETGLTSKNTRFVSALKDIIGTQVKLRGEFHILQQFPLS